jgi:soluble lytic murein transglycosylase-like protein
MPKETPDIDALAQAASLEYNVSYPLVRAIIHAESGDDPQAVSPTGARGLMQINAITQKHLGLDNPMDPEQNVAAGTAYLRSLVDRFPNNPDNVIRAYNMGPTAVAKRRPVPAETKRYLDKVKLRRAVFAGNISELE